MSYKIGHDEIVDTDFYFWGEEKLANELDLFLSNTNLTDKRKSQLIRLIDNVFKAGMDHA